MKLYVCAALLVAVLVAQTSAKPQKPLQKLAMLKHLLSEAKQSWGASGDDRMCAWFPYDCDVCPSACSAEESEGSAEIGSAKQSWGATNSDLECAFFPYDCEKCPSACSTEDDKSAKQSWGASGDRMCAWFPYDCDVCPSACSAEESEASGSGSGDVRAAGFNPAVLYCLQHINDEGCWDTVCAAYPWYPSCSTKQQKLNLKKLMKKLF